MKNDIFNDKGARYALAGKIAEEGIILLKNNSSALPLGKEKLAVFGRAQLDTVYCGTGSAYCVPPYSVSIYDGITDAGINTDEPLAEKYRSWTARNPIKNFGVWGSGNHLYPEMPLSSGDVKAASDRGAEKALYVIARIAGENDDVSLKTGDYYLSEIETGILSMLCDVFDTVIVVMNTGNYIDMSFADKSEIKAVLMLGLPGMEGGRALGKILSGKISPSGALTDTVARSYEDYPSSGIFGAQAGLIQRYTEDIFVGYRYFTSFEGKRDKIRYPFGYGLSYTSFEISAAHFCFSDGKASAEIKVVNTGKCPGKKTVLMFVSSPTGKPDSPAMTLCAFGKTKLLKPSEHDMLSLSFSAADMASFDDEKDEYVQKAGIYTVYCGADVLSCEKIGEYRISARTAIKKCVHIDTLLENRLTLSGIAMISHLLPDYSQGFPVSPFEITEIPEKLYAKTENGFDVKVKISSPGEYFISAGKAECELYSGSTRLLKTGEFFSAVFTVGTAEIKVITKEKTISLSMRKNSETFTVKRDEISVLEGGKYSGAALYVISRPFSDDGMIKSGYALARMHTMGRYAEYDIVTEEAGYYDISLRYACGYEGVTFDRAFAVLVSNVTAYVSDFPLDKTFSEGENLRFETSQSFCAELPKGNCSFKLVSKTTAPPVIAYFIFRKHEGTLTVSESQGANEDILQIEAKVPEERTRRPLAEYTGTQPDFRDVASGKLSLSDFIGSLCDCELAHLSCGNDKGQIGYLPNRGIPEIYWSDGPCGVRLEDGGKSTVYPCGTLLASAWNTSLAEEFGRAAGFDCIENRVDVWLAPGINIHRNPCGGRGFEYYSEDPLLSGRIASAVVRGTLQTGTAAVIKHFAANSTEYMRLKSDSYISARALREIYAKPFEIAIKEGGALAVMTSYNFINGKKVPEDETLCRDYFRKELGFEGVLVTDWGNDSSHIKELDSRHDLKMPLGDPTGVEKALSDGTLDREKVRESVFRILELIIKISRGRQNAAENDNFGT